MAAVPQDGRGSQPVRACLRLLVFAAGGGRPPGRPKIATCSGSSPRRPTRRWRPSPRTAEDRNLSTLSQCANPGGKWRPSPRTAEDRNSLAAITGPPSPPGGGRPPGRPRIATLTLRRAIRGMRHVAVVPQDGRGSQPAHLLHLQERRRRGGRPPGRPRIATPWLPGSLPAARRGGRPPGRPRIATPSSSPTPTSTTWGGSRPPGRPRIATSSPGTGTRTSIWWRPSSRTAEDRNVVTFVMAVPDGTWRPSSRTAEDRNVSSNGQGGKLTYGWRPCSATAEDRNRGNDATGWADPPAWLPHRGQGTQILAISELHTRMLHDTLSRWLARNGLALRTGRVPSVRRYLEGRARFVLDHRAAYSRLKSAS